MIGGEDDLEHTEFYNAVAFDQAVRWQVSYPEFTAGAEWGAGWLAAILGMAHAIRHTYCCDRCGDMLPTPGPYGNRQHSCERDE